jgi:hypothetical protein
MFDSGLSNQSTSYHDSDNTVCLSGSVGEIATQGARLLFTNSSNVAKHVVELSFARQGRGKQLVSLSTNISVIGEVSKNYFSSSDHVQLSGCFTCLWNNMWC